MSDSTSTLFGDLQRIINHEATQHSRKWLHNMHVEQCVHALRPIRHVALREQMVGPWVVSQPSALFALSNGKSQKLGWSYKG
jgi:hypothetical protein